MSFAEPRPFRTPYPALQSELCKIAVEPKARLRARYVVLFGRDPPKAFGPDLLRRSVAQRVQQNAWGGLSKATQRELDRLIAALIAKPDATLTIARRAQSGTVLVRDWKGRSHRVMITADGFHYDERAYSNLSEIARLITGTRWNGPRFFGLRRQRRGETAVPSRGGSVDAAGMAPVGVRTASAAKRVRAGHGL
jgi:hypothetical protein